MTSTCPTANTSPNYPLLDKTWSVVYHLPEKSGNFGWNVNGKTIFFFPNGNFHGKMGILER